MANYRLTRRAGQDYKSIGRYTQRMWGAEQRKAYLADLTAAFDRLGATPHLGRPRDDIRPSLFSYLCGQHVIFFRRRGGVAEIIRILHGRQSPEKAFGLPYDE